MSVRRTLSNVVVAVAALEPSAAQAQTLTAWVPPRGEVLLSTTYQWLEADRHLFSNLTGPELTPLEIAQGTDFQSNSLDLGKIQSHAVVLDGELGITDRFALHGTLAFVAPRYLGAFPEQPAFDNGVFHGTAQDLRVGARYMLAGDLWAVTPFTAFTTPVLDYEVLAHAAPGLGLRMLEVGASVGRILLRDGAAKGYLQGAYGYAFTESPFEDVSLDRSRVLLEGGFFAGPFTLQAQTSWRQVHGGLEWSDLGTHTHEHHFAGHDQAAATREWLLGAGVSVQLSDTMSVEISYGDVLGGANTHTARILSVGWSWGFQAFGAPTFGSGFK